MRPPQVIAVAGSHTLSLALASPLMCYRDEMLAVRGRRYLELETDVFWLLSLSLAE